MPSLPRESVTEFESASFRLAISSLVSCSFNSHFAEECELRC